MCRMGLVNYREPQNIARLVEIATTYYGKINDDGVGYSFVRAAHGGEGDRIETRKSSKEAVDYWMENGRYKHTQIKTKAAIMHTRLQSMGSVKYENSHPFYIKGKRIALAHNGTLFHLEQLKQDLKAKGYEFKGETDSEVLANAYAEYGDEVIARLREYGVSGSCTFVAIMPDGEVKMYTNTNSFKLWKTPNGIVGFSDDSFYHDKENEIDVKDGSIYTLKNGRIENVEQVGDIHQIEFKYNDWRPGKKKGDEVGKQSSIWGNEFDDKNNGDDFDRDYRGVRVV